LTCPKGATVGRILLTGIAGFIGSQLAEYLGRSGWPIRGVDALTETYALQQKRDNLAALSGSSDVDVVIADLARDDLHGLLDGIDAVIHLAGEPGVPASWGTAFRTYVERNVVATQRLLEAATAAGVSRFVYASSSSVYGAEPRPVVESTVPRPLSPYGASKLAGEVLVGAYAQQRGLCTVSLRYFSVYGPRQRPDMATHRFIEALLDDRPVRVFGDGRQARDFTYVGDIVAATSAALTATVPAGTVLNVARGEPVEVGELIAILADELGTQPRIEYRPHRTGDAPRTEGCADAAREVLGWEPITDLRTGLRRQVEWHLGRRLVVAPSPSDAVDVLPDVFGVTPDARLPVPPERVGTGVVGSGLDQIRQGL
jgi:nucleoside-diphosphate-sugar epimerase